MPDCKTCGSPDIVEINGAIAEGLGANTIAARFNVPLQSIKRHRKDGHHARAFKALTGKRAIALGEYAAITAASLIAKSVDLMGRAENFLDRAEVSGDVNAMAKAFSTVERCIRLISELSGAFPQKNSPSIDARHVTINAMSGLSTDDLRALIALPAPNNDD